MLGHLSDRIFTVVETLNAYDQMHQAKISLRLFRYFDLLKWIDINVLSDEWYILKLFNAFFQAY